jgi:hypothetical protein
LSAGLSFATDTEGDGKAKCGGKQSIEMRG